MQHPRGLGWKTLSFANLVLLSTAIFAQEKTVAITVDDLPYASGGAVAGPAGMRQTAETVNRKLLAAFQRHRVPVTGFVIQKTAESLGGDVGVKILRDWVRRGFDLGNHTYSHPDINNLSVEEIEHEIESGEITIRPILKDAEKRLAFFRFPFNHTGDTREKHDAIAAYLAQHGYRLATCTIDNSDYVFNTAYIRILANHDGAAAAKLRTEYLTYTSVEVDYYAALNRQVLGYEPPQVMLLHDNRLNADTIDEILRIFEKKEYQFVPLETAQADAAYQTPGTYITKFGPMWGYRWAAERKVKVNGALEPDPPKWISEYRKAAPK